MNVDFESEKLQKVRRTAHYSWCQLSDPITQRRRENLVISLGNEIYDDGSPSWTAPPRPRGRWLVTADRRWRRDDGKAPGESRGRDAGKFLNDASAAEPTSGGFRTTTRGCPSRLADRVATGCTGLGWVWIPWTYCEWTPEDVASISSRKSWSDEATWYSSGQGWRLF